MTQEQIRPGLYLSYSDREYDGSALFLIEIQTSRLKDINGLTLITSDGHFLAVRILEGGDPDERV